MAASHPVRQDPAFERLSGRWQHAGWIAIGVVLLGAALGLFGPGMFNGATRASPDGAMEIRYPRFWRQQSPLVLRLAIDGRGIHEGMAHFWISQDYLDRVTISAVTPQPTEERWMADGVSYAVAVHDDAHPARVRLEVVPDGFGFLRGRVGVDRESAFAFRQLVHP